MNGTSNRYLGAKRSPASPERMSRASCTTLQRENRRQDQNQAARAGACARWRGTASRTVGLLGAIFTYAVRHRMRSDNPAHGVMRPADGSRKRRLTDDEYKVLGNALCEAEAANIWPAAIAAARFLALTGWRWARC